MSLREKLQTKQGTLLELILFFLIAMLPFGLIIIMPFLILISIGSIKVRKINWKSLGFSLPDFKTRNILYGAGIAVVYLIFFNYIISPLLALWFHDKDLSAIGNINRDFGLLLKWLVLSWTIAAVFEECIFRAYLLNRLEDLFGTSTSAQIISIILAAIPFGFIHSYQGAQGIITAAIFGILQSVIYIQNKKKLAIPVIAHGTFDSIGFIWLFFNKIP